MTIVVDPDIDVTPNLRRIVRENRFKETTHVLPHSYTHRDWGDSDAFSAAVQEIRDHGYQGKAFGRMWTYLDFDGWTYWTMGEPVVETIILNRRKGGPFGLNPDGTPKTEIDPRDLRPATVGPRAGKPPYRPKEE